MNSRQLLISSFPNHNQNKAIVLLRITGIALIYGAMILALLSSNNTTVVHAVPHIQEPTATATETPLPTSTSTATPENTSTPSETPLPSETPIPPTPTPTQNPIIFEDDFESGDLTAWNSNSVTDNGDLSVSTAAAGEGSYGLQAVINDQNALYALDTSPSSEGRYRARFYINANNITMSENDRVTILRGDSQTYGVDLEYSSGYQLIAWYYTDGAGTQTDFQSQTLSGGWHAVEIDWQAASADGVNDGHLRWEIDGLLREEATNLDTDTKLINEVLLGLPGGAAAGMSGTIYFEAFVSTRGDSIGLDSNITIGDPAGELPFEDGFESGDLTVWSSSVTDGGDLHVSSAMVSEGSYSVQLDVDDTTPMYVQDDRPSSETEYHARFYIHVDELDLDDWVWTTLLKDQDWTMGIDLIDGGSEGYSLVSWISNDSYNSVESPQYNLDYGWHAVEIEWQAASAAGANDGFISLWIDDQLQGSLSGIDNDERRIEDIQLGLVNNIGNPSSGTMYLDAFASGRTGHIGLDPNATIGRPDMIFADGFESGDLTAWDASVTDGGDLSVSAAAAFSGSYGMEMVVDDRNLIYVQDLTPLLEDHYRARFYINTDSLDMKNWVWTAILMDTDWTMGVNLIDEGTTGYSICIFEYDDNWNGQESQLYSLGTGWHLVEIEWKAATAPGANNGFMKLWIDEQLQGTLDNLNNDERRIEDVWLGLADNVPRNSSGTLYIDAFESRRNTYIGPISVGGPAVPVYISPVGGMTLTVREPVFTWEPVTGADMYLVQIKDATETAVVNQWYDATGPEVSCDAVACSLDSPVVLADGSYTWYLASRIGANDSPLSDAENFTIVASVLVYMTSPLGEINESQPVFVWDEIPGAVTYKLYVSSNPADAVYVLTYQSSTVCSAGVCTVTPTLTLPNGEHAWYLQTDDGLVTGPWSDAALFNVDTSIQ